MSMNGVIVDKVYIDILQEIKNKGKTLMELQIATGIHKATLSYLLRYPEDFKIGNTNMDRIKAYCTGLITESKEAKDENRE